MKKGVNLKLVSVILIAAIVVCLILTMLISLGSRTGRLHPAANETASEWETYEDQYTEGSEITNALDGFSVQK